MNFYSRREPNLVKRQIGLEEQAWNISSRGELSYLDVPDDRGNAETFEGLAMPLLAPLYNFAHWLAGNREEAEDLVQETFVKALKGFSSFAPGTNFRAWMYRILRNTFLTSRTGLKATVTLDDEENPVPEPVAIGDPEALLLARADQHRIQQALAQLPVQHREIILLSDVEEMAYKEIAEMLGMPIGTVMSRLSRARKALRELLGARVPGQAQQQGQGASSSL